MDIAVTRIVEAICNACPEVQALYLFGSFVTGQTHPDSDVDVALLLPAPRAAAIDGWPLLELATTLEAALQRRCDLVNLRRAPVVLQAEVVTTGRRLYCADELATDEFEMQAMTRFQHFSRERRAIVEAGVVHGFYDTGRP